MSNFVDDEGIRQSIAARKTADDIFDYAANEAGKLSKDAAFKFWKRLLERTFFVAPKAAIPQPEVVRDRPMTEGEAKEFEQILLEFGKYAGEKPTDVPLDYLFWLDDQPDFRRSLRRYLLSGRVQRLQESPDE